MKTTKNLSLLMLSFLLCCCTAIAKNEYGKKVTKEIPAKKFATINLKGAADVIYTQANDTRVSVTAPEKIMNLIEVSVSNNTLNISTEKLSKNGFYNENPSITLTISSPTLTDILSAGSGDFTLKGTVVLNQLNAIYKGSGDFKTENLNCQNLYLEFKGSGDAQLIGKASKATFMIKGSGDIRALDFKVGSLIIDSKGSGDIKCNASEISIDSSGSGSVKYKGSSVIKKISSRGSGNVEAID